MLGFTDNVTLAVTKLRTRRIRLIVTLIVSGLLFTVLVMGSLVIRGGLASLKSFTKDGFSSRFIVSIYPYSSVTSNYDPAIVKRAQAIQKDLIAKKTTEAKRLGVPYDSSTEPKLTIEGGPDGPKQIGIDWSQPAAKQADKELSPQIPFVDTVTSAAKSYELKAIYTGGRLADYGDNATELLPIVGGKEAKPASGNSPSQDPIESFGSNVQSLDNSLIEPFLLEGASLIAKPGDPTPILAPVDAVEELVGLKPLNPKATSSEKLARLKDIRRRALNLTFDVCYRNQAAIDLRNLVKQQADEAIAGKGKADYVAPSLQYANGTGVCTPTIIAKDTRSASEKALAVKMDQFNATFGAVAPQTSIIKFRIVGVMPQLNFGSSAFDLSSLVSSLVTSTLGNGWFISNQAAANQPVLHALASSQLQKQSNAQLVYAEFNDRASQKRFLDERLCQPGSGGPLGIGSTLGDPTIGCRNDHKFFLTPFGNPLAAIYDSQAGFLNFLRWVLLIIAAISAIIMMGTVGKIIADSRKETSVFRAVGAKRLDIAQIYLLYAGLLASLAFIISLMVGLGIALLIDAKLSPTLSIQAVLAFNSPNADKAFHLIGFNLIDLVGIFLFAVATGLISAILPLLTNLRRNPIKDMREE
jgi:hypothetical protein